MATMTFFPFLQEYLNQNGLIYTVRRFLYDPPDCMVYIPGVGGCKRQLVKVGMGVDDLENYYTNSGFSTKEDWWKKILDINKRSSIKPTLYLYKIEKVR